MPITLPADLPAYNVLQREGVMVMADDRATRQDIRPLRSGLLNLMPKKIQTENQFARLIGATPLQIELSLIRMSAHQTKNTAAEHMEAFYRPFDEVLASSEKFDGLIITGAPIEHLPFEDVTYWDELTQVFDWTQTHVQSTFGVCWGGMAMIWQFHNGPNLNLLGSRETDIYGNTSLEQIESNLCSIAETENCNLTCFQSNAEHELINAVHDAGKNNFNSIIINPAAYTHTSIALRDALSGVGIPFYEVHISDIYKREEFRKFSYLSDIAEKVFCGLGVEGYELALMEAIGSSVKEK